MSMAYEIVKFEDDAGNALSITPQDVKSMFCPNATDKDIQLFLALCANHRLNPFMHEAYLVKYGNMPAQTITARAAFQKRADANPDFEGTEIGTVVCYPDGTMHRNEGEAYYPMAGQTLLGGWARVHRKGRRPYYTEVALQEYDTGKGLWKSKPATMISKVAEVHALRGAFPSDFSGMYTEEEMAQSVDVASEVTYEPPVDETPWDGPDGAELRKMVETWVGKGYDAASTRAWLEQKYAQEGIESVRAATAAAAPVVQVEAEEVDF